MNSKDQQNLHHGRTNDIAAVATLTSGITFPEPVDPKSKQYPFYVFAADETGQPVAGALIDFDIEDSAGATDSYFANDSGPVGKKLQIRTNERGNAVSDEEWLTVSGTAGTVVLRAKPNGATEPVHEFRITVSGQVPKHIDLITGPESGTAFGRNTEQLISFVVSLSDEKEAPITTGVLRFEWFAEESGSEFPQGEITGVQLDSEGKAFFAPTVRIGPNVGKSFRLDVTRNGSLPLLLLRYVVE